MINIVDSVIAEGQQLCWSLRRVVLMQSFYC